ncbi:hypothetical protein BH20VER2_BH20VER2_18500 [soil metagenome]
MLRKLASACLSYNTKAMKIPLMLCLLSCFLIGSSFATPLPAVKGRTITEVNLISPRVLKRSISPKFYKTLLISPIDGLIVVRAQLSGTKLFGARVIRSDLGGRFDQVALDAARNMIITGDYKIDTQIKMSTVRLNVLIYEIADGTMALYYATLERPGGEQEDYFGSAKLAVLKKDGSWTEILGPKHLRNLAIRDSGLRNNFREQMRLERIESARSQGAQ